MHFADLAKILLHVVYLSKGVTACVNENVVARSINHYSLLSARLGSVTGNASRYKFLSYVADLARSFVKVK